MLTRNLAIPLHRAVQSLEMVLVHGPRQAGKTTLVRREFPGHTYVSLEDAADRTSARANPETFLARLRGAAIVDDLHRAPELIAMLGSVREPKPLILCSSRRVNLPIETFELHPPTRAERERRSPVALEMLGRYVPAPPDPAPGNVPWPSGRRRFLESDVRDLVKVHDLDLFESFLSIAESRSGQILDQQALARDAGVAHRTAARWLAVLEACFLTFRLPAAEEEFGRRLVRSPRLHFLGHDDFCSQVVSELYRNARHDGVVPEFRHWCDSNGFEIDLVVYREGAPPLPVVITQSPDPKDFARLNRWMQLAGTSQAAIISGRRATQRRGNVLVYASDGL